MKNVFEKYGEIPFKDFSIVARKKEAREEIASTVADVRTAMYTADRLKAMYERYVSEEEYDDAEETRTAYNNVVKAITTLQEKLKVVVKKYEENYKESIHFPTTRNENSVEFVPYEKKIIVT